MGRVVAIRIPNWALPPGANPDLKDILSKAGALRLTPTLEGLDDSGPFKRIRLDDPTDDYLAELAQIHDNVPLGHLCAGLIVAFCTRKDASDDAEAVASGVERLAIARGFEARISQRRLYTEMTETLNLNMIGLHEASTGTGKTLAIVAAAIDRARAGERVVIATPTIALVVDLDRELRTLADAGVDVPRWSLIYGRGEFVSEKAARARLEEHWSVDLEALILDAKATGDWKMATWLKKAPHIEGLSTCIVSSLTPKDDPGVVAYRAQFDEDLTPKIMVCTHAMLAIDAVLRRIRVSGDEGFKFAQAQERDGKTLADFSYRRENELRKAFETGEHRHLPEYSVALVDEGHQLEQTFASVMAVDVSLWQLMRAMRALKNLNSASVPGKALDKIAKVFDRLKKAGEEDADSRMIRPEADEADQFRVVLSALADVRETRKHCDKDPEAQRFVKTAKDALTDFFDKKGAVAMLSFSPSKRFPRLLMGRKTTHREMHYLWETMRAGTVVSATLNITTSTGVASSQQMRSLLNIPVEKARHLQPIVNEEIYRPVTCMLPNESLARSGWLNRPRGDDEAAYAEWCDEIAGVLLKVAHGAYGGTLVLTTSYAMIEALEERLRDEIGDRLIVSKQGLRMADLADRFLDVSAAGGRPVWIATGGAWTGLDLAGAKRGITAAKDNILTDLVITNIPFRTNRSLSHAARMMRGGNFEFPDTYLKFKQGIGRLIRNPDPALPSNRRLWILDGRLHHLNWRGRFSTFMALLKPYRQQRFG